MRFILTILSVTLLGLSVMADEKTPLQPTERGQKILDAYLRHQVDQIADDCLADITTLDEWKARRPKLREQFFDMMGLWPLPDRTPLKATITGTIDADDHTVEKVHFQSSPGLYVTGNLYLPKPSPKKAPAILYVCGHARVKEDGVSYGNKVAYQHHGQWFAKNGYVCLIIDTLQLGELEGIHHGTYNQGMWWWHSRGYTSAGIECWNGMRALDYLQTRPEVDPERLGVTGRSGGGATSWWIGAADDRVKCIIPVAGIADLYAHVVEGEMPRFADGVISGHCDCMYMVNTHRWDFAMVAALCAPRATLLGNSDKDAIFPVGGYRRLAEKTGKIYALYGAEEKFQLLETEGPHQDTPALRVGAFRWMNRWLKNDTSEVIDYSEKAYSPQELKVLDGTPADALNATIQDSFVRPATITLNPEGSDPAAWWKQTRSDLMETLSSHVFGGWTKNPPELGTKPVGEKVADGLRLRAFDFVSEAEVPLRLWVLTAESVEQPKLLVLNVLAEPGWADWCSELGPDFAELLQAPEKLTQNKEAAKRTQGVLEKFGWGYAAVAPRGVGPTRWAVPGSREEVQIKRRFALLGQTVDGQRVWDVRRAIQVLGEMARDAEVPIWVQGKRDMAGIGLYAGIFEPNVTRFDLWELPHSHHEGPTFLNVLRHLDTPQALALTNGRAVKLYLSDEAEKEKWTWPLKLQEQTGKKFLDIRVLPPSKE